MVTANPDLRLPLGNCQSKKIMRQWIQEIFIKPAKAGGLVEKGLEKAADTAKLGKETSLPQLIGNIIDYVLGFVGVILLVMVIYSGFLWMTSGGNDEQVEKSRNYLVNAVIGLIIVLASYAIVNYIIEEFVISLEGPL